MVKFEFNRDFQIKILGLLFQDFDFLVFAHSMIEPDHFSDHILSWFFCTIRDYYMDYQMRISSDILENELERDARSKGIKPQDIGAFIEVYKMIQVKVIHKVYISDNVAKFCRHQAVKAAILRGPDLLKQDKIEELESMLREAVQVGAHSMDMGIQFFVDWPERFKRRATESQTVTMPTGITELDLILGGGLKGKQLGIWMSPTNRGKSIALGHCVKRAIMVGHKAIHITLELSADEQASRYDSSFSTIPMRDLMDRESDLADKLSKMGKVWGNSLMIKEYPTKGASVSTIRAYLFQCLGLGMEPNLIIVDYLDLMQPPRHYKEKRDELTAITEELRKLAGEIDIPIWTATQSTRAAISMETHTEEQVSEDIGKMNTADVVITINQTKQEIDDEIMRLFVAKNRNGPRYRTVKIKTSFDRMSFYQPVGI